MFIRVLRPAAFERTQLRAKNSELFNPETHAQTLGSTNGTRSVKHL